MKIVSLFDELSHALQNQIISFHEIIFCVKGPALVSAEERARMGPSNQITETEGGETHHSPEEQGSHQGRQ